jgi:catechol 2,3-dioxygenase-like lactoylglutathione lyase family enzyme
MPIFNRSHQGPDLVFNRLAPPEMQLPGDNQPIFEIHEVLTEENPGINHIAFRVDNVDETYETLRSRGLKFHLDIHNSVTGRKKADLRDPDGWRLQITDKVRQPVKEIQV